MDWARRRARWIDLDYSSFVAAHALGADYRELGNEGTPALCPLEHASASDENEFLLAFFTRLFARWQTALTAEQQEELAYSIELGASQGLRRARHLAGLVQDLPLRRILNQYTENRPWGHTLLLAPVDLTHVKAYRIAEYVVGVWRHELHGE